MEYSCVERCLQLGWNPGSLRTSHSSKALAVRFSCLKHPNHIISVRVEPDTVQTQLLLSLYGMNEPTNISNRSNPSTTATLQASLLFVREIILRLTLLLARRDFLANGYYGCNWENSFVRFHGGIVSAGFEPESTEKAARSNAGGPAGEALQFAPGGAI